LLTSPKTEVTVAFKLLSWEGSKHEHVGLDVTSEESWVKRALGDTTGAPVAKAPVWDTT